MSYQTFAAFYDEIMDDDYYAEWLFYTDLFLESQNSVLDLACGTGKLAVEMSKKQYRVTGLDLSDEMLSLAYNRALEEGEDVKFIQGDMRELSNIGSFDAVTCFSDSLCYMENEKEVQEVLNGIYNLLNPNGYLLFDVHSLYKINEVFPGYQYHYQTNDAAFLWSSYEGEQPDSIEHALTFFIKKRTDETYLRNEELHKERTYSIDTYFNMLQKAGFNQIDVTADFGRKSVTSKSERWFFACRK